jgi:Family of unknown function (DUF6390)
MNGALLFARFAYPPNLIGHCGPEGDELAGYLEATEVDAGLSQIAGRFDGAWPYLDLIASERGGGDPLSLEVVESYWLGSTRVPFRPTADSLLDRFARRAGWRRLAATTVLEGAEPTHAFHVFSVYPFLGLLRGGAGDVALSVLDQCRVSWGKVIETSAGLITVRSEPLVWDGNRLATGDPHDRQYLPVPGLRVNPGQWVALHWSRVCHPLDDANLGRLRRSQSRHLALANRSGVAAQL